MRKNLIKQDECYTPKWYDIILNTKFKIYIPNFRLGFIVDGIEYNHGAFGIVVIKLQDTLILKY